MKPDLSLYGGRDPRTEPLYSLPQAARLVGVAASTLRAWTHGRPYPTAKGQRFSAPVLRRPEDPKRRLSFVNVIEAHILAGLRHEHGIGLDIIRAAVDRVEGELRIERPLAARVFQTDGVSLFVEHLGELLDAASGQLHFREMLEAHLSRVEYDSTGQAIKLFPFVSPPRDEISLKAMHSAPRAVVVNPFVAFGRPLLNGVGVPIEIIWRRFEAGEEPEFLAHDYNCELALIHDVLRYERLAA